MFRIIKYAEILFIIRCGTDQENILKWGDGVKHRFALAKPVPIRAKQSFTIAKTKDTSPPSPLDLSMV